MGFSAKVTAVLAVMAAVVHLSTADGTNILRQSSSLRENQALKYLSRDGLNRDGASIDQAIIDKGRRPNGQEDTLLEAPPCKKSFKYVYIPPDSSMKAKSPKRQGSYPNDALCGWWFWTDDLYMFEVTCQKIKLLSNDYLVMINEDDSTMNFIEYTGNLWKEEAVDVGVTNDLTVGFETDSIDVTFGFKCNFTSVVAPINVGCVCGQANTRSLQVKDPSNRIIAGGVATDQPWTVTIKESEFTTTYLCSGAIVGMEWILTAGVCIAYADENGNTLWADIGMLDATAVAEYYTTQGLQLIVHPNYEATELAAPYNIGLMRVAPIIFGPRIAPICLPATTETFDATAATVSAWGTTDPADATGSSSVLQEMSVTTMTNTECMAAFAGTGLDATILSYIICAKDPTDTSYPCHRDWGAPMTTNTGSYNELIGVLSGALQCNLPPFTPYWPDIYTRVTDVLDSFVYNYVTADQFCETP